MTSGLPTRFIVTCFLLLLDQSGYRISNYEGRPRIEPANKIGKNDWTHIAAALAANDDMKDIALHHRSFSEALLPHHQRLSAAIKESSAFKDYSRMKTKPEIQDEVQLLENHIHHHPAA